jgi:hypothetical protein
MWIGIGDQENKEDLEIYRILSLTGGLGKIWLWTYAYRGPKGEEKDFIILQYEE